MRSIKAVVVGSLFIIVVGLLIQLAYVFLAVGYTSLAKTYPFLNDISIYFRYFIGIPVFFLIMFIGGYITADLAKHKALLHCLVVAFITIGVMMISALENMQLTVSGLVISALALASTLAGGWYWQRGIK
ncbi:MAG: hypothetical protein OEU74_06505 [Gammaproteobacteria bacterium]|nr:hypothetical protein [Gammaproteobacteria bacterium]